MPCPNPELKQKLYRFVRGELDDAAEREALRAHVAECVECAHIQRELHWLLGTMRRPGDVHYEEDLQRELGARAGSEARAAQAPTDAGRMVSRPPGLWARIRSWLSTGSRRAR